MTKTKTQPEPQLPKPFERANRFHSITRRGWWLVLCDAHVPFHDETTVELAVAEAKDRSAVGVLLNGDTLDFHALSDFDKSPDDHRYTEEIRMGREFLAYLRDQLPDAQIVWKDGNHEERLWRFLVRKAPELFGLDVLTIPSLLRFADHGIEYVTDKRVIRMGHLNVVHGHEYRPTITAPVNPARGLFLRAKSVALCGHFHQTSEHHEPTIRGKPLAAWSVGCACDLSPMYMPLNKWNYGFAMVHVGSHGSFVVENKRVFNGEVV